MTDNQTEPLLKTFRIRYYLPDRNDAVETRKASEIAILNMRWKRQYRGDEWITVKRGINGIQVFRARDVITVHISEVNGDG